MSRRTFVIALLIGLCLSLAYSSWYHTPTAFSLPYNQTVPTRTPIGAPATATQPPDDGGSPGNTPTPTNTPGTNATATQLPVTLAATQVGNFVTTAVPCGGQPTVQALNTTYVRSGPGTDYEIVDSLVYLEVRPVVGRAADAAWWLIELETGQRGWVANTVVDVQGYVAIVPIAVSPPITLSNGALATPTAGPTWNPTPLPTCTVTPTATATASPPPTGTAATVTATQEPTAVATATPTVTPASPTATMTVEAQVIGAATIDGTPEPTVAPLDVETTTSASNLLPIAAGVLLVAGAAVLLVRRRGRQT